MYPSPKEEDMSKQSDIREGIDTEIEFVLMAAYHAGKTGESISESIEKCKVHLKKGLHAQGVVIKVEGELPDNPNKALNVDIDANPKKTWDVAHSFGYRDGWSQGRDDIIIGLRYVAVEPLIGGDQ